MVFAVCVVEDMGVGGGSPSDLDGGRQRDRRHQAQKPRLI
jgi:hypothetical protein